MIQLVTFVKQIFEQLRGGFEFYKNNGIKPFFKATSEGSIGRNILTILFFTILFKFWLHGANPPETMITAFYTVLGYNLTSKFFDMRNPSSASSASSSVGTPTPMREPQAVSQSSDVSAPATLPQTSSTQVTTNKPTGKEENSKLTEPMI